MPKKAKELSAVEVRRLRHGKNPKGMLCGRYHAVGEVAGLLLCCKPPLPGKRKGARSWILRVKVGDKRRDIGLGGYPDVTLSEARQKARKARQQIEDGIDPVAEKMANRAALIAQRKAAEAAKANLVTFEQVAREYIAKKSREFKSAKQVYKLTQQLEAYAFPVIGKHIVGDIGRAHIIGMLEPIWDTKHETASRVRLHVERVLDLAGVKGLRTGDNPARWKGNLELSLTRLDKAAKRQHHNALAVDDLPAFWRELSHQEGTGARALQFAILTAARPGEARGARWDDINLRKKLWTIPSERMKSGREHTVPLTDEAVKLLRSMPKMSDYVFPSPQKNRTNQPVSDVMLSKVPKVLGHDVTAHGFRATFRTWAQEYTGYPEEVPELALAHVNSDRTRAAYARSELIDKRRELMDDWEHFILKGRKRKAKVVPLKRA